MQFDQMKRSKFITLLAGVPAVTGSSALSNADMASTGHVTRASSEGSTRSASVGSPTISSTSAGRWRNGLADKAHSINAIGEFAGKPWRRQGMSRDVDTQESAARIVAQAPTVGTRELARAL